MGKKMTTMTISTGGEWHLKGVPQTALKNIERQPYGGRVMDALEYLAAIEHLTNMSEENLFQDPPMEFTTLLWHTPADSAQITSGTDVLCELQNQSLDSPQDAESGLYAVYTYFKGGDKLDNEVPLDEFIPEEASEHERLLGSLLGNGLEEYSSYAPQSGFYRLSVDKRGYGIREQVPIRNIARWAFLPCTFDSVYKKKYN